MVEIPALAISSTDCRQRKRRGEPVWYLVPDGVVQYIAKHDLYTAAGATAEHPTSTTHRTSSSTTSSSSSSSSKDSA
jgi:nicotinate-nucleotide adenylyltransferase